MNSLFSLADKVVLITGGAQGLGRMIAEGLVQANALVYITSRKAELCAAAADELGPRCRVIHGDAGTPEGIIDIVGQLRAAGEEKLHVLINNAGKTWGAPFDDFPDKAWPGVMAVNVQAPFRMIQECIGLLAAAGNADDPARVINIGSVAGSVVNDLSAYSYVASKAALHQVSQQLAADLVGRHINVNTILPGFFPTSMTAGVQKHHGADISAYIPMQRLGRPDDIVGAVSFLASRAGAYITGINLPVDGGFTEATKFRALSD